MIRFLPALALTMALVAASTWATDDVANGQKLYLGQPNASFPSGSYACDGCHNVNDKVTPINVHFRAAAGDPSLIDFAINSNPLSTSQMRQLYGIGFQYELSTGDESDLAAYINSVVNPGGTTMPTFNTSPSSASFGFVSVGMQSAVITFTVFNSGSAGTLTSVSSSNNTEFLVAGGTCIATPQNVAQSGSCTVQVIFAPVISSARSSTITILNNGTPNPLTINVAGTGTADAPAQGILSGPTSATFATQSLFVQSAATALTFRNVGAATATIFSVNSSNPTEFPVTSSTCIGAVAVNGTCVINVAFSPSAPGGRSATLTMSSDGVGNPQAVQLSGTGAGAGGAGTKITVVEYYNAGFDHYFISPVTDEIALLGKPPFQDWQPTGLSFNAYAAVGAPTGSVGICRFFNDHFAPRSTHFYAPHGLGCETTIAQFPDWSLEDPQLFYAYLPDAAGNCRAGTIPVYRLYNNGQGGAPNHRFTTSIPVRQAMIVKGSVPEGNGIGVGMCVPQ